MSGAMLEQFVLIVHLLLALAIIGLIMLQQGKGAEMGASFGAGASQTLFGSSGSGNVLTRATAWLAALFFVSSFGLAMIAKQNTQASDDLGIPLPSRQEMPAQEIPAAQENVPAMDVPSDDELPSLPGAAADGMGSSANADMPEITENPDGQ